MDRTEFAPRCLNTAPLPLTAEQVDIWRIPLDRNGPPQMADCLAEDEIRRADRFLADKHRVRFRNGRIAVRRILAHYLDIAPTDIAFEYTSLGKPFLRATQPTKDPTAQGLPRFNFSNSADWGLLAISLCHDIGIDLECIRSMSDMEGLARRFFAPSEVDAILSLANPTARQQAFFRCWTRKEAFLKAVGKGLTFPLEKVCVTTHASDVPRIVSIDDDIDVARTWSLHHLDPVAGYVGALAAPTTQLAVQLFEYAP